MYMSYRHASKGSKINTDLIDYVTKTIVKKEVRIPPKHVEHVLVSYDQIGASIPLCVCHTDTLLKVVRSILI